MKLIVNASPLIFLAKIEMIDFLPEMVDELVIPQAVVSEIEKYQDEASLWIQRNKQTFSRDVGNIPAQISAWDLGAGETDVITFAFRNKGFTVALDDKAARNCAQSLQISVIGTIGLILFAKQNKIIEEVKPYLIKLKSTGYRISDQLFKHALKLAKS